MDIFSPSPPLRQRNQNLSILSEVSRQPNGSEWLWHPKVVGLYKLVLQQSDGSTTTREAAIGALQNITAGEGRVRSHTPKKCELCICIHIPNCQTYFLGWDSSTRKPTIVLKCELCPSLPVGISVEWRGGRPGEDAAHLAGSVRH